MHIILCLLGIFLMLPAMPELALAQEFHAGEPHSSKEHHYKGSVYNNGEVLTLSNAIKRAIETSPRLKSVSARLDAAKGSQDQAGYWQNPELYLEAENIAGSGAYSGTDSAEYSYGVSQKFEIGGKRSARKGAAMAIHNAAKLQLAAERLNLERDVHIAYEEVLAEAEALKLAIEQEKLAKEVMASVYKRVRAAAEPEIQLSKAEVAYSSSIIAREQEERQLSIAKEKLARLWGASTLDVSLDHAHFFDLQAPESLDSYKRKLTNVPDIQRFSYLHEEKQANIAFERAQKVPDPSLNMGIRSFNDTDDQAFLVGVSFPIPVWNQNKGNITKANAELMQVESDMEQAKLMLEQQLIESWQHWNSSYSESERLKNKLLPAAEKAFTLARSGYQKGKFAYLEVLDAQRTLFQARSQFHEALKRYHSSRANVERLTTTSGETL